MARAAATHAIPLPVLYAVGLTETGRRGRMNAWSMNVDGRAVASRDRSEALRKLDEARKSGARFIDIGCMQINARFHGAHFRSPAQMFEPQLNVDYAARFLRDLRAREGSWTKAVARYNAGPGNEPAQKKYICAVIRNMVESRAGAWTPSARAFCG